MSGRKKKKQRVSEKSSDKTVSYYLIPVFMILIVAGFIAGGAALIVKDIDLKKNCTAYAEGEVVRVEVIGNRKHRRYKTYIEAADSVFPVKDIVLDLGGYEKGQSVTIHYDPNDYSSYYVEGTSADRITGGIGLIAFGMAMLLAGLLIKRACKEYSKE